jgi:ABC-type molybdate transport system substrate-binding protein
VTAQATSEQVPVSHAGSLKRLVEQDLRPGFTAVSGYELRNIAGPAVGLANQVRQVEIAPDVYMSADAEVNDEVLMGEGTTIPRKEPSRTPSRAWSGRRDSSSRPSPWQL